MEDRSINLQIKDKVETGIDLDVPRWNDIKNNYDLKFVRQKEKALTTLKKRQTEKMLIQLAAFQEILKGLETGENEKKIKQIKVKVSKSGINPDTFYNWGSLKVWWIVHFL